MYIKPTQCACVNVPYNEGEISDLRRTDQIKCIDMKDIVHLRKRPNVDEG